MAYAIELLVGFLLGGLSGRLFDAIDRRHRRKAGVVVWSGAVLCGLFYALRNLPSDGHLKAVMKVSMGGALYGAFLSTALMAVLSAITLRLVNTRRES